MPRGSKCRRVCSEPSHRVFSADSHTGEVTLSVEELESLRLADLEEMEQDAAAERMGISRGTFQRILYSARQKTALALTKGKTILINGGNYVVSDCCCGSQRPCRHCCYENDHQISAPENKGEKNP